jgi:hypothetical protein
MQLNPSRYTRLALAALLAGGLAACEDDNGGVGPTPRGEAVIQGTIGANRTLVNDTTYTLRGQVVVPAGVTLTIEPGTTILGDADVPTTFLLVRPGGKLEAAGTAENPIVFTSSRPAGQRKRGDWGGVVLAGNAPANCENCQGEGPVGSYGGSNPDDDSGTLRYVRIEYVGQVFSANNELNGLTLYGVGRATEISHVQVHFGLDDGIEFFGGTVNLKHAVVTGAEDDSFDYSTGWTGKGQFWLLQQDPTIGDRGWEVDGNEDNFQAQPFTSPQIYNMTLVGKGPGGSTATTVSPAGMQHRRGTAGIVRNGIVLGFVNGLDIDDQATVDRCTAGLLVVSNVIFGDVSGQLFDADADTFEQTCASQAGWGNLTAVTGQVLTAPYNLTAPDFRPVAGSPALTSPVAAPPADGFFTNVNYLGAVAPTGTPWYQGWTTFAQN